PQLAPPSVLLNTAPVVSPAYRVVGVTGSIAREETPKLRPVAFQLAPPSVLLNTPPSAPAYRVVGVMGSIAKARPEMLVRPVALQFAPPSVLLNRPPPLVHA